MMKQIVDVQGDSPEITLDAGFCSNVLWLFLIMQLLEMCDKNIWYGARLRVMTRQRCVKNRCNGTH